MSEGVIGATTEQFKSHPYLWGGLLVGVVVLVYFYSSGSKSAGSSAQSFNFSYGPSDAQVVAGTQLQIAQVNANAQAAMAATNGTASTAIAGDYFNYLATNSANQLTATQQEVAAATTINGQNVGEATYVAGLQSASSLASIAGTTQVNMATANWTGSNAALATNTSAGVSLANQASAERIAANTNQTSYLSSVAATNANLAIKSQLINAQYYSSNATRGVTG